MVKRINIDRGSCSVEALVVPLFSSNPVDVASNPKTFFLAYGVVVGGYGRTSNFVVVG